MPSQIVRVHLTVETPGLEPALQHDIQAELEFEEKDGFSIVKGFLGGKKGNQYSGIGNTMLDAVLKCLEQLARVEGYLSPFMYNKRERKG